jgi:pilus assembly protein CpaC
MKSGIAAALFGACLSILASSANAADVVPTARNAIEIDMNKGTLVRLQRPAASIFIANPEIADVQVKSPRLVYILAKRPGETVLYAVDEEDRVLTNQRITVSHNLTQLREAIKRVVPNAPIEVNSIDGTIILSGRANTGVQVEDARRIARQFVKTDESVVNTIHVSEPNQVNLRVRVAEVSRSVLKAFGVNWDTASLAGDFTFGLFHGSPIIPAGSPVLTGGGPPALVSRRNFGTNSLFAGFNDANNSVNSLLDALDSEGLVTILAEPNLTAVSGKSATFLAGGEFPVPDSVSRLLLHRQ